MAKSLWRTTGKSKQELGIVTPKAPRFKKTKDGKLKCHCLFRGSVLWQECRKHVEERLMAQVSAKSIEKPAKPELVLPADVAVMGGGGGQA